jgi:hypothetical protein
MGQLRTGVGHKSRASRWLLKHPYYAQNPLNERNGLVVPTDKTCFMAPFITVGLPVHGLLRYTRTLCVTSRLGVG